ncbi:MAG: hypothetical protein J6I62_04835, partial [Selenomonadaceae bacterium]|nr:hypothetical protein [Selenomonadaceae bacterium]
AQTKENVQHNAVKIFSNFTRIFLSIFADITVQLAAEIIFQTTSCIKAFLKITYCLWFNISFDFTPTAP